MRKIFVAISLLVIFMFVVSCTPQMTDEELEAELAKLTPEEREELVKHLEAKESGALAGQASRESTQRVQTTLNTKGVSQKILKVSPALAKQVTAKLAKSVAICTDSDGGEDVFTKGITWGTQHGPAVSSGIDVPKGVSNVFILGKFSSSSDGCEVDLLNSEGHHLAGLHESSLNSCSDVKFKPGDKYGEYSIVESVECFVREYYCGIYHDAYIYKEDGTGIVEDIIGLSQSKKPCPNGCKDGACLPPSPLAKEGTAKQVQTQN